MASASVWSKISFCLPLVLPADSEVKVKLKQRLKQGQAVAQYQVREEETWDVATALELKQAKQVSDCLTVKPGEQVSAGQVVAQRKKLWRKLTYQAPAQARFERLNHQGEMEVVLSEETQEVHTPIKGTVTRIADNLVEITVKADKCQGELAWGQGLNWGQLVFLQEEHPQIDESELINADHQGQILIVDKPLNRKLLYKAAALEVAGLIAPAVERNFDQWYDKLDQGTRLGVWVWDSQADFPSAILDKLVKAGNRGVGFILPEDRSLIVVV